MTRPIFREAAMDRLAAPEQFDQLMPVTSRRGWIALTGFALLLVAAGLWSVFGTLTATVDGHGVLLRGNGVLPLPAPVTGTVTRFLTHTGDKVGAGEPLVLLTPPAQPPLKVGSPVSGRMLSRSVREGETVKQGTPLLMLENLDVPLLACLYVPVSEGYRVEANMRAEIWPANVNKAEFGFLTGRVVSAARFPITREELADRLQNDDLARELTTGPPKLQILVALTPDSGTTSGYRWSMGVGPPLQLFSGTPCQGRIILAEHPPIHLVFPGEW